MAVPVVVSNTHGARTTVYTEYNTSDNSWLSGQSGSASLGTRKRHL